MERHPGYRVEIIGGSLTVTRAPRAPSSPGADRHHPSVPRAARFRMAVKLMFVRASACGCQTVRRATRFPDLSVVDADIDDHLIEFNCYDPAAFRLVLEVTSSNYNNDLRAKAVAYAQAGVPVYVIVNRKHQRVHVLTDPAEGQYASHRILAAGELATLPDPPAPRSPSTWTNCWRRAGRSPARRPRRRAPEG